MFGLFKKKQESLAIGAPVKGKTVDLYSVKDPTFGEEILGKGVAILPEDGNIFAPADGEISMIFDTGHAVSLVADTGCEILVHVGLDTVKMKGDGFVRHVKNGDHVSKGQLLLEVDLEKVKAAGYDTITPIVICNTSDYEEVSGLIGKDVLPGEDIITVKK